MSMRKYVILVKDAEAGFLEEGMVEASSRAGALRQFFSEHGGECVAAAIPERSWKPQRIRREVQTHLKIG